MYGWIEWWADCAPHEKSTSKYCPILKKPLRCIKLSLYVWLF